MEDPQLAAGRSSKASRRAPRRNPPTTPVERSPSFFTSTYPYPARPASPPWSPAVAAQLVPCSCHRCIMQEHEHPLHCRDISELESAPHRAPRDRPADHLVTLPPPAGWDWRTRKWIDSKQQLDAVISLNHPQRLPSPRHQHRHHHQRSQQEAYAANESIDGRISRLRQDAGRMVSEGRLAARRSSRYSGWVSELDTIAERKRRDGYGGEALTRIRRDKVGSRSRRRAHHHHAVDLQGRRKHMRREVQLRRDISARRNKLEGEIVSSLQLLEDAAQASKSFSLQTLEEYLIEKSAAKKLREEDKAEGLEITSVQMKYPEKQPRRATRRSAAIRPMKENCAELESQLPLSIYTSEDGRPDADSEAQRPGCGLSWRWLNAHPPKDESSMAMHAGGGNASKRRIGRRLLVSRERRVGCIGWDKYTSECSLTSFDSDSETAPLMTEPEPFHDYTTDEFAGSPVVDSGRGYHQSNHNEAKTKKASRFRESGMLSNGPSFRKTDYDSECKDVGMKRHRSLSQKHRPKTFKDLVGQPMLAQSLSNAVLRNKIAPVYLFQGPRGTGKTCAARIFTAALNCLSAEELRPCGTCQECTSFHTGKNFDVREVDATGNNGIESMRLLLKHISLPPSSRYKVFIIDECHALSIDSWNAFLKSLEEPPSYVVFILVTTDAEQLPRTALSRCQKFLFSKIKDSDIVSRLQKIASWERIDVEVAALQLIASRSDGSLREAEMTLDQISLLGKRVTLSAVQELIGMISEKRLIEFLEVALSPDSSSTVKSIRDFMESGVEPLALISQLATLITDIIAGNNRSAAYRLKQVRKVEDERFRQALRILSDAERQIRSCTDRTTWLTAAFLQFSHADSSNVPPYSLGTSITQSPVNFFDTSEKETVEGGDVKWDPRSPPSQQYKAGREDHRRLTDSQNNPLSGRILTRSRSPKSTTDIEDARMRVGKPPVIPRALSSGFTRAEAATMSSASMHSIWKKVLDSIRSNVIKQLLRGEAKLLSLSVNEALAVAHLEFRHPEHKNVAEKASNSISNAFQEALGCPVELKVTLASASEADESELGQQKKTVPLSKGADNKAYPLEDQSLLQDQRVSRSGSFRKSSTSGAKFGIPVASSPRFRLPESRKPREVEGSSPYNQRYTANILERDRSLVPKGKPIKEGGERMPKHSSHASDSEYGLEKSRQYDGGKGGRRSNALSSHKLDDADGGRDPHTGDNTEDSDAEPQFCHSQMDGVIDTDKLDGGSDSEPQDGYGSGLLCWKGARVQDGKGKHQRLRRKRRGRLLLRFVPCAKR